MGAVQSDEGADPDEEVVFGCVKRKLKPRLFAPPDESAEQQRQLDAALRASELGRAEAAVERAQLASRALAEHRA
eukprot:5683228-Prymnesium_polylepis.1